MKKNVHKKQRFSPTTINVYHDVHIDNVLKTWSVFTKILRIFLRITFKSKKNSMLRIFLFLE